MDGALWAALRALEKQSALGEQPAERTVRPGDRLAADRFSTRADAARRQAQLLRRALLGG